MGGICSPSTTTAPSYNDTVTNTEIPAWMSQAGQNLFGQAAGLAELPYTPYQEPRIAGFAPQEQQAFDLTSQNVNSWQPAMNAGEGALVGAQDTFQQYAGAPMAGWNDAEAKRLMDPYTTNVTDIAAGKMQDQYNQQQIGANAKASMGGAFGGARHTLMNTENTSNFNEDIGNLYTTGQSNAYNNAQNAYLQGGNQALQAGGALAALGPAYAQLGTTRQAAGLQDAASLQAAGSAQRSLAQQSADTAYQDYLEQREHPYRQVNFALGALGGVPFDTRTTGTQTGTQTIGGTSALGQVGGALASAYGAYKLGS